MPVATHAPLRRRRHEKACSRSAAPSSRSSATIRCVASAVCLLASAAAQDGGPWGIVVENDSFGNDDSHYTNGFKLEYTTARGAAPDWLGGIARNSALFGDGSTYLASYGFGQNMFTSSDISDPNPPLDDRPYAGWLYGEVSLIGDAGEHLNSLKVNLGVVGPASLAGTFQTEWHDLFGWQKPEGWDTQLENEPALLVAYERRWRMRQREVGGFDIEAMPTAGVTLGNVYTYASLGANLRIGRNMPYDYGAGRIQPGSPGAGYFEADSFGFYVFAGVEGRAIARNIFLDGNTWQDSRSVDKNSFVGDLQAGIVFAGPKVRVALSHVFRTKEFETQEEIDDFGAISVSFRF